MKTALELLADLVAIPSINPGEGDLTRPEYGEREVVNYLEHYLRQHGIACERQEVLPQRENLLARVEGRDSSRTLLLHSHTDTVNVEHMSIPPFDPVVREGKLYGRGACDAKGQLAAMLTALLRVTRGGQPAVNVVFVAGCEEEYRFRGVSALVEAGLRASAAVVGEPTELDLVIAHKGAARWWLEVEGVAAHSSAPTQGVNAIYRLARAVQVIEEYAAQLLSRPAHPLCGPPTIAATIIEGGQQANVVPDRARLLLDRRTLPGETQEQAEKDLKVVLDARLDFPYTLEVVLRDYPLETPKDAPLVRRLAAIVQAVTGREPALKGVAYGTDASKLARVGIPSVVFGPGSILRAHTAEEYLELDQLEQAVAVYERLLREGV
ncbi:MAG TPA: M20 family peptidase [Armatimonadetes bacterium]|nr:M20 family peptidase [Armatimonadota bacterium]